MKREIKFRAWSNEYREMYYKDFDDFVMPENAAIFESGLNRNGELFVGHYLEGGDYEDLELMQYTGLKDKNGKEIYEGDIVEFKANYTNKPCGWRKGVIFIAPYFLGISCVYPIPNWNESEDFNWFYYAQEETDEFPYTSEVIGNIYEHPELLKQDK